MRAGEDVEADFEIIGEAVGDLEGLVQLVFGGVESVDRGLAAFDSEVAVEFEHGVIGRDQFRSIHLDLVIVLAEERE